MGSEFSVVGRHFVLDGAPFQVRSGEMHYPRVPREYWRARLQLAKSMGLNTICTYVFWNLHESKPGKWNFEGDLDLGHFIECCAEMDLKVIIRPGPYICTELDFGGFPAWLLKDRSVGVRNNEPQFMSHVRTYLNRVGEIVSPFLLSKGGPVIMAQVENEYGSFGNDKEYLRELRQMMLDAGFECQHFTSDGVLPSQIEGGTLPEIPAVLNFAKDPETRFALLDEMRPPGPHMIGEYWCGWFDHWGKAHHRVPFSQNVADIDWCMKTGASFNFYMFHGGTNFGFLQGANDEDGNFDTDTTSYDYDAPVDECGRPTEKFNALRELIQSYLNSPLPETEFPPSPKAIPEFEVRHVGSLLGELSEAISSDSALTFEELDQAHGFVLCETTILESGEGELDLPVRDRVQVIVNQKHIATLDRRKGESRVRLELAEGDQLWLLVESLARVNFGLGVPHERKGLDGEVLWLGAPLLNWNHYRFPLESPSFAPELPIGPQWYRGTFSVEEQLDSFLDLRKFSKGFVWVNGKNLGRFWRIGPQQTLYLPGVWLKSGENEIVVLDEGAVMASAGIVGLAEPILDELPES